MANTQLSGEVTRLCASTEVTSVILNQSSVDSEQHCFPFATEAKLCLSAGQFSDKGAKAQNEDAIGIRIPNGHLLTTKGAVSAISDGVSLAEKGAAASAISVSNFLADYYSTPALWSVKKSSSKVLTALNRWLYGLGQDYRDARRGYVCTFSALVFKSCHLHMLHIGDSRIYRYREGQLQRLSYDHVSLVGHGNKYLARALGLDLNIDVDYQSIALGVNDIYLLMTDGVHDVLDDINIKGIIEARLVNDKRAFTDADCEELSQQLVESAINNGSIDNVSCQCISVNALPELSIDDLHGSLTQMPFPPALSVGMKLDGYTILKTIYQSQRSQVYLIEDMQGQLASMKTPSLNYQDDPAYIERFILESWIGERIRSPQVIAIRDIGKTKTALYYLTEYIEGMTLKQWIRKNPKPDPKTVLRILTQIEAGVRAFHRRDTLHQDLKPENVLIDGDEQVKIIDFGACFIKGVAEISSPVGGEQVLGTADYSAPEVMLRYKGSHQADLYSLAVIAFEMLTGELPFKAKQAGCKKLEDFYKLQYTPSYELNPLVPIWMDYAIRKSLNIDASKRHSDTSEWLYDMRTPEQQWHQANQTRPLIARRPLLFWQSLSSIFLLVILLLVMF
ncbi:bifunctional protein-serine/threonine kinase/phosphatase [Shewanella fidelis]|uniref:bifunctional protein-serine/threonine kinase/phosphatase n=1 Tax=Shewanella fidelis TaxID=173509 RepID=UPI0004BAD7A2|nr:bifunctional protein-serine/threonine kinase/phosphatase [Shewanella fidelis]